MQVNVYAPFILHCLIKVSRFLKHVALVCSATYQICIDAGPVSSLVGAKCKSHDDKKNRLTADTCFVLPKWKSLKHPPSKKRVNNKCPGCSENVGMDTAIVRSAGDLNEESYYDRVVVTIQQGHTRTCPGKSQQRAVKFREQRGSRCPFRKTRLKQYAALEVTRTDKLRQNLSETKSMCVCVSYL